jgi:hypothetical protein
LKDARRSARPEPCTSQEATFGSSRLLLAHPPALLIGWICRCWRAIKQVCCRLMIVHPARQAQETYDGFSRKFGATDRHSRAAITRGVWSLPDAALAVASRVAVKRGILAVQQRPTNILGFSIEYAGCRCGGVGPETDCTTSACARPAARLPQTTADFSSQDSYHRRKLPRYRARSKWQSPLLQLRAFCARCGQR